MSALSGTTLQTDVREYRRGEFLISTDRGKLDVEAIQAFLTRGYFDTAGIAKETVARATRGSLCFGVYDGAQQVGFARIIAITPRSRISAMTTS